MNETDCSPGLWENIIGGFIAALLLTGVVWIWNGRRRRIIGELTLIMGQAIEHRNAGERRNFTNEGTWLREAKVIEAAAIAKAAELSPAAKALVAWLDRIDPWTWTSETAKYVSILSKVVERIRGILERNTV